MEARRLHAEFRTEWKIECPIHSVEVRGRNKGFLWLNEKGKAEQTAFYEALYQLMREAPVVGLACVIDRPGYNLRYREKYGRDRWSLCKTAFNISVERAAKYARGLDYRLRVSPKRCNKAEDRVLKDYYEELKKTGLPFAPGTSEKYRPLAPEEFTKILYEFKPKCKSSPMAQLADLYLWPICMGGYDVSTRPYRRLMKDGMLIECTMPDDDKPMLATKYSCFDLVEHNKKGPEEADLLRRPHPVTS
jgi:hypothetical protein